MPAEDTYKKSSSSKKVSYSQDFTALDPGTAYIIVETENEDGNINRKLCRVTVKAPAKEINIVSSGAKQVTDGYAEGIGKVQTRENLIYVVKKGAYSRTFAYTDPLLTTDTKVSWSAKGGAVTVKNGVMYGRSLSKKNKNGAYVPSVITVKCGKAKETFSVIVIE